MRLKKTDKIVYVLKKLIPGERIGLTGFYAAVPDKGYKGHPFTIKYMTGRKDENNEWHYTLLEKKVQDWNKAEIFRKQPNIWGSGFFTLGYFKMTEEI